VELSGSYNLTQALHNTRLTTLATTVAEFGDCRRGAKFGDKLSPFPATMGKSPKSATIVTGNGDNLFVTEFGDIRRQIRRLWN